MYCHEVHSFWQNLVVMMNRRLPARHQFELSTGNIIFGDRMALKTVNLIILVAKQYIVLNRTEGSSIPMSGFRVLLHRYFLMEGITQ